VTLAITLGDVTGIGPEITAKALAQVCSDDATQYVVFGDRLHWLRAVDRHAPELSAAAREPWEPGTKPRGRLALAEVGAPVPSGLPYGDPLAGGAALAWVQAASQACTDGILDGLVTAPLSKESVVRAGHAGFTGQTEFIAAIARTDRFAMMLLGHDDRNRWLRVALVTTHLPLRKVADAIQPAGIRQSIDLAAEACDLLGLARHRVGVCGLNPHAGEGGLLGSEDRDIIAPTVLKARADGIDAHGPLAADTLFHQALHGAYDAVVAQYHDQGLGPLKLVAFDSGVNWTLGLPFVRTSPDHGTAYDIAGSGTANPSSMVSAIRLAGTIARRMAARRATR
jgi:4-hydroxythreonine-4-phosphate dehydrogenase